MKKFLLTALGVLFCLFVSAQDFAYGSLSNDETQLKKYDLDTTANAVVLKEYGTTYMQKSDIDGRIYLYHTYHVRIKIFNKNGYNNANIVIPLRKSDDLIESIIELKASTFNLDNGTVEETALDKSKTFTENRSKYTTLTKFTLPNIKEGSIIEYTYQLKSPFIFNFRTWEYQSTIPKMYSEYVAIIPGIYIYNVTLRGPFKLTQSKAELSKGSMRLNGVDIDCSKMTYVMKNIPAFIEEEFMTAASNFRSAIYFELAETQQLNGSKTKYTKEWKNVDYELTSSKDLGSQMKQKNLFKELMPKIIKDAPDTLSKAKAIYQYIKKAIKWNNYYGCFADNGVKTALEKHSGSAADINLALISALSAAGLDAEAVILSTRDQGTVNKLYPILSDFNYLIAKVNINGNSYLLDATDPLMPFGLLPQQCINDQGRVINLKKPSYWIDLVPKQKRTTKYILSADLTTDGKLKGTIMTYSFDYAALNKRKAIKKYNTAEEYVEKFDEDMPSIRILNQEILDLDNIENPLTEKYEIVMDVFDSTNKSKIYFNPFFISKVTKNPFNLNERTYPVDLTTAFDQKILITINVPENFELVEIPKNTAIALPQNAAKFVSQSAFENNIFSFNQSFQLNKPIYESDEYLSLKEFYSRIIQLEKTDLILKQVSK